MIQPNRLSEPALAILRGFIRSEANSAGDRVAKETLDLEAESLERGLEALGEHGLVEAGEDGTIVLTDEGERFFRRFHRSCH